MPGNTFGHIFRITTFGESHGATLGVIIDGCPPGISVSEKEIQRELDRRKPGDFAASTDRKEPDTVKILSGIFEGKTLGTPIASLIHNKKHHSKDYEALKNIYRPGHADFTYEAKYGIRDHRGGGRASGRETVARVIAGAIAKKILNRYKTEIYAHTIQIGNIRAKTFKKSSMGKNHLCCADEKAGKAMEKLIKETKNKGDSLGGIIEIIVKNPVTGLGEPVFDKLEADLGKALLSIGAVTGVEFGSGFDGATKSGSENNDELVIKGGKIQTASNNAGGILGGISSGQDIIIRIAVKPTSSIAKTQKTITKNGKTVTLNVRGRHDACIIPRLISVAESMVAITMVDHLLRLKTIR